MVDVVFVAVVLVVEGGYRGYGGGCGGQRGCCCSGNSCADVMMIGDSEGRGECDGGG